MMDVHDEPFYQREPYPSQPQESTPKQDEPRQERDKSRYSLTAEAASELFIQAGVPRALRTIIRYCSNGTLDCIKVDTERNLKYLVAPDSVHTRIAELRQIVSLGHDAPRQDTSRHGETIGEPRQDMASHDAPRGVTEKMEALTSRVGELEQEKKDLMAQNRDLEISNRVKDALLTEKESVLEAARNQLSEFGSRIMRFNRVVGKLETMLRLKAPEEDTAQIVAYLDEPTEATELERENFVDGSSGPLR
jgi:hypothetical protein